MSYQNRINHSLQFIRNNLDRTLTLEEIAKASHFSSYHFHRIFHALMGETVHEYTSRLRLETTVHLLRFNPEMSITEIAYAMGYSSSANFSKAFKAYFGVTPRQIRQPDSTTNSKIGKIKSKYGKDFQPAQLYPIPMERDMALDIAVREIPQQHVCSLSSQAGYERTAMFATWDKLATWAAMNGIPTAQQQRFALCYDNPFITPIDKCRYDALMVIDTNIVVRQPFHKTIIPAGWYAVMRYKGEPAGTAQAYMAIYGNWFPDSGFEPDHFPLMEHYLNDVRQDGYVNLEMLIKLKELRADR